MGNLKDYYNSRNNLVPLVHCINNYVTIESVADAVHAVNASPIMSEEIKEVEDVTKKVDIHYINLGMINSRKENLIDKLIKSTTKKIIFDPVGVGFSGYRNEIGKRLIESNKITVIKGNKAEIKSLLGEATLARGVDSIDSENEDVKKYIKFSLKHNIAIVVTGSIDTVCYGNKYAKVANGSKVLPKITGGGCMLGGVMAAELVRSNDLFNSLLFSVLMYNVASELAEEKVRSENKPKSFKIALIDYLNSVSLDEIEERGKYEIYGQ